MNNHVLFDLSEDWHNDRYGIDFGEDFWVDLIRRAEAYRELSGLRAERFLDTELGSNEPEPHPVASGQYGHRRIPALFGCKIKYTESHAPSAEPIRADFDELAALDMPDLHRSEVMRKALDDAKRMKEKYGFAGNRTNTGSPLNAAASIFGEDFLACCAVEPDAARHVLMVIAKTFTRLMYEFEDVIAPPQRVERDGLMIGNCPAVMFSSEMYREVILPADLWFRGQFRSFGIRHCGILDNCAELYAALTPAALDVGGGSDYRLRRRYFPNAVCSFIVNPELFEGKAARRSTR